MSERPDGRLHLQHISRIVQPLLLDRVDQRVQQTLRLDVVAALEVGGQLSIQVNWYEHLRTGFGFKVETLE